MTLVVFYIFAAILLISAVWVITAKNPVHAALSLVLSFFTASVIWMLMEAEFLSIALVLVYVGAVMVLFLFVVMMLDINFETLRKGFWSHFPVAILVGGVMAFEMVMVLLAKQTNLSLYDSVKPMPNDVSNIQQLGQLIYTEYLLPFELAAVLLLVAIIAAISLTLRQRKSTKYQDPAEQIQVKKADRLRIISMKAERSTDGADDSHTASN